MSVFIVAATESKTLLEILAAPAGTVTAALIAAALGSWIGAQAALARFRKERAFDRRLDWYQRMISSLLSCASELAIAKTVERGFVGGTDSEGDALAAWQRVQLKHLEINKLTAEGVLYAKEASYHKLWRSTGELQDLADLTDAFHGLAGENLNKVGSIIHELRQATNALAGDMREQLGLEPLKQHPRDVKIS